MRPRNVTPKPHTAGIAAVLTTVAGVMASPLAFGILPGKWATGIAIGGALLQAFTKPVHAGDTVVVSRDDAAAVGLAKPKEMK